MQDISGFSPYERGSFTFALLHGFHFSSLCLFHFNLINCYGTEEENYRCESLWRKSVRPATVKLRNSSDSSILDFEVDKK